ncbi:hypothetical protein BDZ91DRAFT_253534 [Kalaharituber pfeilii]|nr:hypothetical protein BDZ91DRAFT_253534 [Kalaharituber pfeilii]
MGSEKLKGAGKAGITRGRRQTDWLPAGRPGLRRLDGEGIVLWRRLDGCLSSYLVDAFILDAAAALRPPLSCLLRRWPPSDARLRCASSKDSNGRYLDTVQRQKTGRQADRQTGRQTDRQTNRQTDGLQHSQRMR